MLELERILDNKPVRPPAISTLALRWQSACPPGASGSGVICGAESPKDEEISMCEENKETSKVAFCEIQWQKETLAITNKFLKSSGKSPDVTAANGNFITITNTSSLTATQTTATTTNTITSSVSSNPLNRPQLNLPLATDINTLSITTATKQRIDSSAKLNNSNLRLDFICKTADAMDTVAAQSPIMKVATEMIGSQPIQTPPAASAAAGASFASQPNTKKSIKRNSSIISFKSLDFNLKSFCSSIKNKHSKDSNSNSSSSGTATKVTSSPRTSIGNKPPYVKVETVDKDGDEDHLISFPHSPYSSHRSSLDKSQQYLQTQPEYSRSQTNSPFLSITTPPNIRRSSTSDIIDKKPSMASVGSNENRRPSTSELLRRARERKGSESKGSTGMLSGGRMGRSTSGGLPRGGRSGRRTSMAF